MFFICNKMNTTSMTNVIQICTEFYSDEVIENSKELLYESSGTSQRLIKRRGSTKKEDNVKDMCTIFY
jgi:hypothetical protein